MAGSRPSTRPGTPPSTRTPSQSSSCPQSRERPASSPQRVRGRFIGRLALRSPLRRRPARDGAPRRTTGLLRFLLQLTTPRRARHGAPSGTLPPARRHLLAQRRRHTLLVALATHGPPLTNPLARYNRLHPNAPDLRIMQQTPLIARRFELDEGAEICYTPHRAALNCEDRWWYERSSPPPAAPSACAIAAAAWRRTRGWVRRRGKYAASRALALRRARPPASPLIVPFRLYIYVLIVFLSCRTAAAQKEGMRVKRPHDLVRHVGRTAGTGCTFMIHKWQEQTRHLRA